MPFGITSAPEIFQMKMHEVVQGLNGIEVLADDLLVCGSGDNLQEAMVDHNKNLKNLLIRLREKNCKLNRQKLNLCQTSVKFYGHILTNEGVKADTTKVDAIKNMKSPSNKQELQRFIGMVTYLSRYIPNLSGNIAPLRKLTLENTPWTWTASEEAEFNRIKDIVCNIQPLKYFDPSKPVVIECDSSSTGLGAVLIQDNNVVAYASRTLTKAEQNYAQIEKELLAIVFACVRFDQMVVGHEVIARTDHKPLINIFKKPLLKAPKRLQLMLMVLQRYSLHLEFIQGSKNVIADTLSRAEYDSYESVDTEFIKSDICQIETEKDLFDTLQKVKMISTLKITEERLANIQNETKNDQTLQRLINTIQNGWPKYINNVPDDIRIFYSVKDFLSTSDGYVFYENRIVIPFSLRGLILNKLHISHNGIENTMNLAKQNVYWPGINTAIKDMISKCDVCAKFASSQRKPPMMTHDIPEYPFEFISMDVFFAEYRGKQEKFLVTVDHYSDFFELNRLKDLSPKSTIEACKENFSRYGIPQKVLTDNGTNFVNAEFTSFSKKWEFRHITSAPHHQQANGKAEATVKIAKRLLQKVQESREDLWYALLNLRNIPNKIEFSPAQRLLCRKTRSSIPTTTEELKLKNINDVPDKIIASRQRAKYYYDKKTRSLPELVIGQPVMVQINPQKSSLWTKGVIDDKHNDRSYSVSANGSSYRRDIVNIKPHNSEEDGRVQMGQSEIQIEQNTNDNNITISNSNPIDYPTGVESTAENESAVQQPETSTDASS